mmetsp:Transcript_4374/g.18530  ORF Transcript_4374/g.18530 Transcript_4374/m.18530 type:complete len:239 (+) Transcript_4374:211-927(+)
MRAKPPPRRHRGSGAALPPAVRRARPKEPAKAASTRTSRCRRASACTARCAGASTLGRETATTRAPLPTQSLPWEGATAARRACTFRPCPRAASPAAPAARPAPGRASHQTPARRARLGLLARRAACFSRPRPRRPPHARLRPHRQRGRRPQVRRSPSPPSLPRPPCVAPLSRFRPPLPPRGMATTMMTTATTMMTEGQAAVSRPAPPPAPTPRSTARPAPRATPPCVRGPHSGWFWG